ncbi:HemK2/MTQ2 family protein methyltransferase [Halosegnis sp.]|uniref:HemK2/MTQ2 family protein methyltransferase n=1 Tax=Halosegnis sp. TaxID=2864959 RepID=UPI0035D4A734
MAEPNHVYEPAEDSRLLAETALARIEGHEHVLEVGTGSGYVAGRVAEETGARVVASDVNPYACRQAWADTREAGLSVAVVRGNLAAPFQAGVFDRVLFNPPYLPRDPDAERDDWQERALTGGETGREVIKSFLDGVSRVLSPGGSGLLVVSTLTDIEAVAAYADKRGLAATTAREESFLFERLAVLQITTKH